MQIYERDMLPKFSSCVIFLKGKAFSGDNGYWAYSFYKCYIFIYKFITFL